MLSTLSVNKVVLAVILSLCLVFVGCAGSSPATSVTQTTPKPVPTITLSLTTIDPKIASMDISGTGFTPGGTITGGIPDLKPQKNLPESQGVWFLIAQIDDKGAFTAKVDLTSGLWRMVTDKQITIEAMAGEHPVVAEDNKGLKAETKITIKPSPPSSPTPAK